MAADLNLKVAIRVCPTVREPDGLALSSRNQYLTPSDRQRALVLYHSLILAKELYDAGEPDADKLREPMHELFRNTQGVGLDYAEIVSSESLEKLAAIDGPAIALVAARVGGTRLIDNLLLTSSDNGP
jgi:pantoate--beta-alanine ligase